MTEKVIRIRLPEVLYRRFKVFCAEKDLSIPKQTAQLIRNCLQIEETNQMLRENSHDQVPSYGAHKK